MTDPSELSEEELVRAAQAGMSEAFTALYDRYLPLVFNRVCYVIPKEDVEDVTQEIFIAVIKSIKGFRYEARFSTWLRTLINRQVADYYRKRNPWEAEIDDTAEADMDHESFLSVPDDHNRLDDEIILKYALSQLPVHYREVILMRFADGLQFDEIARMQNQSMEATKSLFRRAIASLQTQVINAEQPEK